MKAIQNLILSFCFLATAGAQTSPFQWQYFYRNHLNTMAINSYAIMPPGTNDGIAFVDGSFTSSTAPTAGLKTKPLKFLLYGDGIERHTVNNVDYLRVNPNYINPATQSAINSISLTPGPQGATGPQGIQGVMGPQGPNGPQGDTGPAGPKGDTGVTGPKGDTGATGAQGIPGIEGPKGDTGSQGGIGLQGPTGATGSQGPKGDTGAQGVAGPKGDTGIQGPAGANGQPGVTFSAINNILSRSIVTSTSGGGFQIDAAKYSYVSYSITIQVNASGLLAGASSGYVVMETASTNSTTASDWKEIGRWTNGQTFTSLLTLASTQPMGSDVGKFIQPGYFVRLRSVVVSGTPTFTINSSQEVKF